MVIKAKRRGDVQYVPSPAIVDINLHAVVEQLVDHLEITLRARKV